MRAIYLLGGLPYPDLRAIYVFGACYISFWWVPYIFCVCHIETCVPYIFCHTQYPAVCLQCNPFFPATIITVIIIIIVVVAVTIIIIVRSLPYSNSPSSGPSGALVEVEGIGGAGNPITPALTYPRITFILQCSPTKPSLEIQRKIMKDNSTLQSRLKLWATMEVSRFLSPIKLEE